MSLADDLFKDLSQLPDTKYYYFFGRFMHRFSMAETGIHILFRKLLGLPDLEARAINSGMRPPQVEKTVKSIFKYRNMAVELSEIETTLSQFEAINTLRDALVHRHVDITEYELRVHNVFSAKTREGIEIMELNIDDIVMATQDLNIIILRLGKLADPHHAEWNDPDIRELLAGAWQYKPRPPKTPKKARPGGGRLPAPPPPSSPEKH